MTDGTRFRVLGIRADGKERKKKITSIRTPYSRLRLFFHFANLGRRIIVEMAKKRQATPQYARGHRDRFTRIPIYILLYIY